MENESSNWNGRRLKLKRTSKVAVLSNVAKIALTKLAGWPWGELLLYGLMTLALGMALSGCATQSVPSEWPRNPQPPQLSEPIDSESYLSKALKLIESWRAGATGM